MRRSNLRFLGFFLGLNLIFIGLLIYRELSYAAQDKTAVQIIENKARPSGSETLTLKKELTIGKLREGGSMFGNITGATVAANGRIVILDYQEKKIKIFDPAGKLLKEFGREGQGPGEWNMPVVLQLVTDDQLMVVDHLTRKLVYLDLDGNLLKEVSYAKKSAMPKIIEFGSRYLATEMGLDVNSIAYNLAVYDVDFNQLFKIDTLLMPMPTAGRKIDPFEAAFEYCFDSKGNIIYGRNKDYEIKYFTPEGKLFKIVKKDYKPQPVSEEFKQEILNKSKLIPGINFDEMLVFPEKFPAFNSFFVDEYDRLYVRTFERGKARDLYLVDIFNPKGELIARSEMPENILLIKGEKLYCLEKDEEDYQYLCRYQLIWKK
ncbi:MAG: 6-bladed beta-propeller [Candidatus Saccharicenans sp.]|uniref:6-bladed beta-propeller n=1 Tax=Candidatus Saccharicenans sp. TaxID=2819258 RepID=UPI00404A9069